jgi:hypothetical protein
LKSRWIGSPYPVDAGISAMRDVYATPTLLKNHRRPRAARQHGHHLVPLAHARRGGVLSAHAISQGH